MQGLGDLFKLQNGRPDLFVFDVVERSFADPAFFGKPNERHAPVFSHVPHQNVHSLSPLALSCQRNPRFGLFGDHHSRFVITYHKTPCVQSGRPAPEGVSAVWQRPPKQAADAGILPPLVSAEKS